MTDDEAETIDPMDWTDDEWLWVMTNFPPNATVTQAGKQIAIRRKERSTNGQ